ncbi:MAG: hypothetical protein R3268_07010 [Acidiferrobacterales bacterium]|nr:hypothetical protein [Acidiferrobacterales bacterium]
MRMRCLLITVVLTIPSLAIAGRDTFVADIELNRIQSKTVRYVPYSEATHSTPPTVVFMGIEKFSKKYGKTPTAIRDDLMTWFVYPIINESNSPLIYLIIDLNPESYDGRNIGVLFHAERKGIYKGRALVKIDENGQIARHAYEDFVDKNIASP